MLLPLPTDHTAEAVRDALTKTVLTLPNHLRRSLTSDQGKEMSQHRLFTIDTDVPVYFRDPHSPWQRGSNENTNGLLRQYFLKSTDLRVYTPDDLMPPPCNSIAGPGKPLIGTPGRNASICSSIPTNNCSVATIARNRPIKDRHLLRSVTSWRVPGVRRPAVIAWVCRGPGLARSQGGGRTSGGRTQ